MTPLLVRRVNKIEGLVSLLNSKQILSPWLITMRHFTFNDNRGGRKSAAGESDDEFFRQRGDTSFNDNGGNRNEEGFGVQQRSEELNQTRVLRGQKPSNRPPLHSQEYDRGGRRPKFDGNRGNRSSQIDVGFQGRNVDETGRDGGRRGNKSSQIDLGFQGRNINETSRDGGRRGDKSSQIDLGLQGRNVAETDRDGGQSGDSFLDKYKLGFDNEVGSKSDVEASSQFNQHLEARAVSSSNSNEPAQQPMPQDADEIFKKMKETGLIPNAVAMLDGLCKDGNVQEALKLFGLMREKGTIPEIVIYTAVVEGYTKAHKADDAIRIFRKMQSNGISPNAFSYTVLIQGLYKCSRLQDAVEFCVEMLEAGHSLNVTTFVGLVDCFCKENGIEEAKGVIKTLTGKGFAFDEKAVKVFLDKKAPFSPSIWEAIFGKKAPQMPF